MRKATWLKQNGSLIHAWYKVSKRRRTSSPSGHERGSPRPTMMTKLLTRDLHVPRNSLALLALIKQGKTFPTTTTPFRQYSVSRVYPNSDPVDIGSLLGRRPFLGCGVIRITSLSCSSTYDIKTNLLQGKDRAKDHMLASCCIVVGAYRRWAPPFRLSAAQVRPPLVLDSRWHYRLCPEGRCLRPRGCYDEYTFRPQWYSCCFTS